MISDSGNYFIVTKNGLPTCLYNYKQENKFAVGYKKQFRIDRFTLNENSNQFISNVNNTKIFY